MVPLLVGVGHVGLFAAVKAAIDRKMHSLKELQAELSASAGQLGGAGGDPSSLEAPAMPAGALDDLMGDIPTPWEVPAELSFSKLFVTILLASHMGICQSSLYALVDEGTPPGIAAVALVAFCVFPCGFVVYIVLTLRGAAGGGSMKWGKLLFSIPKAMEKEDLEFKPFLPRVADLKKKLVQQGAELADEQFAKEKTDQLSKKMKSALKAANLAAALRDQGTWEAGTPAARRFLAIWGGMLKRTTDLGYLLMGFELVKKLLQAVLLTVLEKEHPRYQLLALQGVTALQMFYVLKQMAYNERLRNVIEPLVLLTQYCTFLAPLLYSMEALDDQQTTTAMMASAILGVLIALGKEMLSTIPGILALLSGLVKGSEQGQSAARREVGSKLLKLSQMSPEGGSHGPNRPTRPSVVTENPYQRPACGP